MRVDYVRDGTHLSGTCRRVSRSPQDGARLEGPRGGLRRGPGSSHRNLRKLRETLPAAEAATRCADYRLATTTRTGGRRWTMR
jgi:hypothetical protein